MAERLIAKTILAAGTMGVLALLLLLVLQPSGYSPEARAQINEPGFNLQPVDTQLQLGLQSIVNVEVTDSPFSTSPVDSLQVTIEFDPTVVSIDTGICAGDLSSMQATDVALVEANQASFTCFGNEVSNVSDVVATVLVTGVGPGTSALSLIDERPFSTGFILGGTLVGQGQLDGASVTVIDGDSVSRSASATEVQPDEEVTITLTPDGITSFYAVEDFLGELELVSHTADALDSGVFVMIEPNTFEYVVRVPASAQPGDEFPISGAWWEDPGNEFIVLPNPLVLKVPEAEPTPEPTATPTPTATATPSPTATATTAPPPPPPATQPPPPPPANNAPSAPQNVQAVAGDASVTISWEAPASDGGTPLTGYRLLNINTSQAIIVLPTLNSTSISGLTNGTPYSFQLSAINAVGPGASVLVGPVTPSLSAGDQQAANQAAQNAFGAGVNITSTDPETSSDGSGIKAVIPATGLQEGQAPTGEFDFETDDLVIDTDTSGAGTATLKLSSELSITGPVNVTGSTNGIQVSFQDAKLKFNPVIQESEQQQLDSSVGTPVVSFDVDVTGVQQTSSVSATYSSQIPDEVSGSVFAIGTSGDNGALANDDIAYTVAVTKTDIGDDDLQDNTVMMSVGKEWYEARDTVGKSFVITKVSDDGQVFTAEPDCVETADTYVCTATFTGQAGGFSEFVLGAFTLEPPGLPTPTATTGPTATSVPPTAVPTATPVSPTPEPTFGAPTDPPTPEPTATATSTVAPTATAVPPTEVPVTPQPTDTAVPQATSTPGGGSGDDGGGVPAWVFILAGIVAIGVLGLLVLRGVAPQVFRRA